MRAHEGPTQSVEARCRTETGATSHRLRAVSIALLVLAGAWFGFSGYRTIRVGAPDFEYFYKAGRHLYQHGTLDPGYDIIRGQVVPRGTLDWYWPCVSRFMTPLAGLRQNTAGYIWLALNLAAMVATWRLIGRHLVGRSEHTWPGAVVIPVVCGMAWWVWEFRLNQINNFTLLFLVGSFVCWQRGRPWAAGLWAGLAVLLKLTPALLVLWYALKRQYRTAAAAGLTVLLAGPIADVIALGPDLARDAYRAWLHEAITTGSQAGLVRTQREMDWRNQALGAVLCRWLHPTNYATHFDNDPRVHASYGEDAVRTLNAVALPLATVEKVVNAAVVASLLGLLWLARRPARRMSTWQLRCEWAVFVLATLWLMPVLRRYHLIWVTPAAALVWARIQQMGLRSGWSKLALVCLALAAAAQLTLVNRVWEAAGSILLSIPILALPLVVAAVGREPRGQPAGDAADEAVGEAGAAAEGAASVVRTRADGPSSGAAVTCGRSA